MSVAISWDHMHKPDYTCFWKCALFKALHINKLFGYYDWNAGLKKVDFRIRNWNLVFGFCGVPLFQLANAIVQNICKEKRDNGGYWPEIDKIYIVYWHFRSLGERLIVSESWNVEHQLRSDHTSPSSFFLILVLTWEILLP